MRNSIRKEPQINADERRFIKSGIERIFLDYIYSNLINSPQRAQSSQRSFLPFEIESEKILQERNGTRMTRIGRIFTDPRLINRAGGV